VSARQASAEIAAASYFQAEAAAFVFQCDDDVAGCIKHLVENGNRRYRMSNLLLLQRYKNFDICLVLKMRAPLGAGVFDLVFRAVPLEFLRELNSFGREFSANAANFEIKSDASHQLNQGMFCNVTEFVEDVERIIPSIVTIERSQKRLDFRDQILASTPYAVVKIGRLAPEGKGNVTGAGVSVGCQVRCEGGMIETSPRVLNDFGSEDAPLKWESLSELKFVDFVNAIRVRLSDVGVWCFSEKVVNLGFEILEMLFCADDAHLRAIEETKIAGAHGRQTRSDEESRISKSGEALLEYATTAA